LLGRTRVLGPQSEGRRGRIALVLFFAACGVLPATTGGIHSSVLGASSQAATPNQCSSVLAYLRVVGQGPVCESGGRWFLNLRTGRYISIAPPDRTSNLTRNAPAATAAAASTSAAPRSLAASQCVGAGKPHIELYYAHFKGAADNFSTMASDIQQQFISVDQDYMNYDTQSYFGMGLHLPVLCDSSNMPLVRDIALSTPIGTSDFSSIVSDMQGQGKCQAGSGTGCTASAPVHYWVYTDGNPDAALGYAGQSTVSDDDSASAANIINSTDQYSINYGYCLNTPAGTSACDSPIDTQGPGNGPQIFAHENGHAMGAVQLSAPDSTNAWHCTDGTDVMCYNDGGSKASAYTNTTCSDAANGTAIFDCNFNDYFNPAPAAGSYLAGHWDIAASYDAWVQLQPAPSSVTLQPSATHVSTGQPVTLTATVSPTGSVHPGMPSGSVAFMNGASSLGSAPVNAAGIAALTTSSLTSGTHMLTASFSGSSVYAASTSSGVAVGVGTLSPTQVWLTSSLQGQTAAVGQPVTFTATVTPVTPGQGTPSGSVTLTDGATTLGTFALGAGGAVTLTTSSLTAGTHSITAAYSGDTTFSGSSATITQGVAKIGGRYVAVTPYRVFDSRSSSCVQCNGSFGPGAHQDIPVARTINGGTVPANATAVAINLTGVSPSDATFLQLTPTGGGAVGATSNLNLPAGTNQANLVIVPIGNNGKVTLYNSAGTTDALMDVQGYFLPQDSPAPASTAGTFHPIAPLRLCDTRANQNTACAGASATPLGPGESRAVTVWGEPNGSGSAADVPTNGTAVAVALNLTATQGTAATYLTAYPTNASHACGPAPNASNVNLPSGIDRPNRVIVPIDRSNGEVCIYNSAGSVNVVIDVNGWFGSGAETTPGALYYPTAPVRVCDTRSGQPSNQCSGKTIAAGATLSGVDLVNAVSIPGEPASPIAAVANITGVDDGSATYLTVYPDGTATPNASDLNIPAGAAFPNLDLIELGAGGTLDIYNSQGSIDAIVDLQGWFAP